METKDQELLAQTKSDDDNSLQKIKDAFADKYCSMYGKEGVYDRKQFKKLNSSDYANFIAFYLSGEQTTHNFNPDDLLRRFHEFLKSHKIWNP